ncbi:MAG TPA: FCD domain-containing protein, partial [Solirubrobacteraceae bacterium]|nr:FCD domain-containing protein [Solirubrobacteraceae bacterium]
LAVERAGSSDLERMERLVDRMSEARRFDAYRRADTRFHIALAEAARSPRLLAEMTDIQGEMSELIALIPHPERVLTRSNAQHARLVHALGRRDAARSVRVIREHLAGTEHILAALMPGEPPDAGARADQPRSNMRTRS